VTEQGAYSGKRHIVMDGGRSEAVPKIMNPNIGQSASPPDRYPPPAYRNRLLALLVPKYERYALTPWDTLKDTLRLTSKPNHLGAVFAVGEQQAWICTQSQRRVLISPNRAPVNISNLMIATCAEYSLS
jgi:hypothetical protein